MKKALTNASRSCTGRILTLVAVSICLCFLISAAAYGDNKQSISIKPYGYFKLDGAIDQNLTSHGNSIMWVEPKSYESDDEQFNMTANQSRFGFTAEGTGYSAIEVFGRLEMDLYAGATGAAVADNTATLQLRHAYFSISNGNFSVLAGQTSDLISPLDPSTLNYSMLWSCGNIGYRRPQVSLSYTVAPNEQTDITLAGGFFRTIGSDLTPTITLALGEENDGSDDGTDAGIPSFQSRIDVTHDLPGGNSIRAGISGLWGQLKAETNLGKSERYESWGIAGHFALSFASDYGFSGEVYSGSNLGNYLGAIANNSLVDGLESFGGWTSAWVKPSPKIKLVAGFGYDNPNDEDLSSGDRSQNRAVFGNIQYSIISQAIIGVEIARWKTDYKDGEAVDNLRTQTSFILKF
ncbi:MAG: hypothetical protein JSV44_00300 [Candidatus Zixiibacteriota bacterium]|nr:MAG: hypothetical protein JSV44_00300 [candidate division Zixibacteria bacterium]